MKLTWAPTAFSRPALCGVSRAHFSELLEELAPQWEATRESALCERRGGVRRRAVGAGRKQRLVFTDRLLATLVRLRLGLPHAAPAELFEVDRSTISTAIREVTPLLAARGFAVPDITHQPNRQANTPRLQLPPRSLPILLRSRSMDGRRHLASEKTAKGSSRRSLCEEPFVDYRASHD